MTPDKSGPQEQSAIPGLAEVASEGQAKVARLDAIAAEGNALNSVRKRALSRIQQMQADALAGRPVDMLEFSILKSEVERAEARLDELIAAGEALADELSRVPGQIAAVVRPAMERRERIAEASQAKGYRA